MARHQEKRLRYFPFDVDFFKDRKIRRLYARYGADGIAVYLYVLCSAYDGEGYFLKADEFLCEDIGFELNMSEEKIGQIINFLCKRSLFDDILFTSDKVLTSRGIQARFQEAVKIKAQKTPLEVNADYWLLESEETESYIKVTQKDNSSEKKGNSSEKKGNSSEKKDTNKIKVKESKVNKSKEGMRARVYANALLSPEDKDTLSKEFGENTSNAYAMHFEKYCRENGKRYEAPLETVRSWILKDKANENPHGKNNKFCNYKDTNKIDFAAYDEQIIKDMLEG